ncbi:hypothetical protein Bbelb_240800 [Branchiostoma belcheri]|nr:hypothetical protein Bbelb_240800 [Branchiostoma belcheri]
MVHCIIVGCGSKTDKKEGIRFASVPKVVTHQGEEHQKLTEERRRLWISAISRGDTTTKNFLQTERVCGRHFVSGKAAAVWDRHNVDWVPTLNLGRKDYKREDAKGKQQKEAEARAERAKECIAKKKRVAEQHATPAAAKRTPQNPTGHRVRQIDFAEAEPVPLDVEMAACLVESKEPQNAATQTEELQYVFRSVPEYQESKIASTQREEFEYMLEAWGGRTSDKFLTENCGFMDKLLPGDTVMADRGFTIDESVGLKQSQLVIPAFTKGKAQLDPVDVEKSMGIASDLNTFGCNNIKVPGRPQCWTLESFHTWIYLPD